MPSLRPKLHHVPPPWVKAGEIFFLTVCTRQRGNLLLADPTMTSVLITAAQAYHERRWWCRLWLVMPDHVHGLVSLPVDQSLAAVVGDWKRFTKRHTRTEWQDNFFDHRVRSHEQLEEKARYIRENPVRAGLIDKATDWPWVWEPLENVCPMR